MKNALDMNEVSTLSTVLLTNLDENLFFAKISEFMMNYFEEYKVLVFEAFSDGSSELKAINGGAVNSDQSIFYSKGQGLSGYVIRMKRAYYSNSKRDPLLSTSKRDDCVESEISVPIIFDGTILGTIHIQSKSEDRKFSERDVTIVNKILDNLAAPIANMRMYLMAKNLNRDLQNKIVQKDQELSLRGPITQQKSIKNSRNFDMLGHSNAFVEVVNIAKRVANEDFPVLVTGSSGSGKKLLGKKIHSLSDRNGHKCITVHCAAIDEDALELELFGTMDRPGILESANGGTIVLDSVDELPLGVQAKLLRVMISGEIYNVDGHIPKPVNIRVISTTRISLESKVEEGSFREDLLYRLNIISVKMPSLDTRQDDIKILSEHFLNNGKSQEESKILTSGAIEKLSNYNWPGNVQELRNIMERTFILCEDKYIEDRHLPEFVKEVVKEIPQSEVYTEMTLHELEKIHICKTLDHLGGNKTRAAKLLGITVKTLYNKLHSYGLVNINKAE